jgi:AraC family transcriptional regulator
MAMYETQIQNVSPITALTTPHSGSYMRIGDAFRRLHDWFSAHGALPANTRLIAIYYDDPTTVSEENLRSRAGVVLPEGVSIQSPFDRTEIPGGDYAVLRHVGPYSGLANAYQWLYQQWLPQSGREAADTPPFEQYLNTPADTPPADLLTNIFVPLR